MPDEQPPLSEEEAELSRKILLGMRSARKRVTPKPFQGATDVRQEHGILAAIIRQTFHPPIGSHPLTPKPSAPLDILLPLGTGSSNDDIETRFTLRSIERHATGYRRIYVVGHLPGFLKPDATLVHVPMVDFDYNHEANIAMKLAWTFETVDGMSDHALLWNDDYLMLEPQNLREIPFYHLSRTVKRESERRANDTYAKALRNTYALLKTFGAPARHYDVHIPMVYNRQRFLALYPFWQASADTKDGIVVKSTYANYWGVPGVEWTDLKLRKSWHRRLMNEAIAQDRWIVSYDDSALAEGMGTWMRGHFPTPSRWEADQ